MNAPDVSSDRHVEEQAELALQPGQHSAAGRDSREETPEGETSGVAVTDADDVSELDELRSELALMFGMPQLTGAASPTAASPDEEFESFRSGDSHAAEIPETDESPAAPDVDEAPIPDRKHEPTASADFSSDAAVNEYMKDLLARNRVPSAGSDDEKDASTESDRRDDDNESQARSLRGRPRHRLDSRSTESVQNDRLDVVVRRTNGEQFTDVRLVDVSLTGAQLSLPSPVTDGERLAIEARSNDSSFELHADAVVRWTHLARDYRWATGVELCSPLSDDTLRDLAQNGLIDRRRSPRTDATLAGTVRRQTCPDSTTVRLTDVSSHGFRVHSQGEFSAGERIMVQLAGGVRGISAEMSFPAYVRWSTADGEGAVAGCEYADARTAPDLAGLLKTADATELRSKRRARWAVIAVLALTAFCLLTQLHTVWRSSGELAESVIAWWVALRESL